MIPKLFIIAAISGLLGPPQVGVGAYYTEPGLLREVCERRARNRWYPDGVKLHCSWPCLVAGIEHDTLGDWVLIDVPGASYHYCQVVDVGNGAHLEELRERGEVIEIGWELARQAGWTGYTDDVRVWWIGGEDEEAIRQVE